LAEAESDGIPPEDHRPDERLPLEPYSPPQEAWEQRWQQRLELREAREQPDWRQQPGLRAWPQRQAPQEPRLPGAQQAAGGTDGEHSAAQMERPPRFPPSAPPRAARHTQRPTRFPATQAQQSAPPSTNEPVSPSRL